MTSLDPQNQLAQQIRAEGLPTPETGHPFTNTLGYTFSFAWPEHALAVEIEDGIIESDIDKMNQAVVMGWKVLRFGSRHVMSGEAIRTLRWILTLEKKEAS